MADRYWVGGTDNWDATAGTKWATTSGGAGGEAVPTTSDDVYFDGNSGAVTVTVSGTRSCRDLNFTGFTGTFTGTSGLTIRGGLVLSASSTYSITGTHTFSATTTGHTITTNGVTVNAPITFNGSGGGWTLADNLTMGNTRQLQVSRGTVDFNDFDVVCGNFVFSTSSTKTLNMGNGTITIRGSITMSATGSSTFNAESSTITTSGTSFSSGLTYNFGSYALNNVELISNTTSSVHSVTLLGLFTVANLSVLPTSNIDIFNVSVGNSFTVSDTLTLTGFSATRRIDVYGQNNTITADTTNLSNADIRHLVGAGDADWDGTSLGNGGCNTGITFTTPTTRYWVGGEGDWSDTANWSDSSGGTGGESVPICHDTVIFDYNSFSAVGQTINVDVVALGRDITFYGETGAKYTSSGVARKIYGNLTLDSGMEFLTKPNLYFIGGYDAVLTTDEIDFSDIGIVIYPGKFMDGSSNPFSLTLNGNLNGSYLNEIVYYSGIFDLNGFDVNLGGLYCYNNYEEFDGLFKLGDGTITIFATTNISVDIESFGSAGDPLDADEATIIIDTSDQVSGNTADFYFYNDLSYSEAVVFNFANVIVTRGNYQNVRFRNEGGDLTIKFQDFRVGADGSSASLQFRHGKTFAFEEFTVEGNPSSLAIIKSMSAGSATTLSKSGGIANAYFASIQDITATGGADWFAHNSTDVSGNTGWDFFASNSHSIDTLIKEVETPSHTLDINVAYEQEMNISIDGVNRDSNILVDSFRVIDNINQRVDEAFFDIRNVKPNLGDEVIITFKGQRIFGGAISQVETITQGLYITYRITCKDYTQFLDRKLVNQRYEGQTAGAIIENLRDTYATDFTIDNVDCDLVIQAVTFNRITVSQAIQDLAELINYSWYVDSYKDIHFFAKNEETAPFNLTNTGRKHIWNSLRITEDFSQIRNQITVIGGEYVSEERSESYIADGEQKQFPLAYKYSEKPVVKLNTVAQEVGIDGLDPEDDFDCFWSFQQKYVRFKISNFPDADDVVEVTGTPLLPVIVRVPDTSSIAELGVYEYKLKDKNIQTREDAIQRAVVELEAYAQGVEEGSFDTYEFGLRSGQIININVGGTDEDFVIQSVSMRMINKDEAIWSVRIATARTLGIIGFLQKLLRDDEEIIEGETLLELLNFDDEGSIGDSLNFPSRETTGPYKWADATDTDEEGEWNFATYE
jgi:hypothetical protein